MRVMVKSSLVIPEALNTGHVMGDIWMFYLRTDYWNLFERKVSDLFSVYKLGTTVPLPGLYMPQVSFHCAFEVSPVSCYPVLPCAFTFMCYPVCLRSCLPSLFWIFAFAPFDFVPELPELDRLSAADPLPVGSPVG